MDGWVGRWVGGWVNDAGNDKPGHNILKRYNQYSQETLNTVEMHGLRIRAERLRNCQNMEEALTPASISEYSGCMNICVVF